MNKLIIALVVVLIGIQSWTLKTQQQILEAVTSQIEIEVELENETNEKVNFASEDPYDLNKTMKGYCKYFAEMTKYQIEIAKFMDHKEEDIIENVNKDNNFRYYEDEKDGLVRANLLNNLYNTYCID